MADMITELTQENFTQEVLNASEPVLVDFWAIWCSPCRAFSPILEEFAGEHPKDIKVCKLNVDDCRDLAAAYRVMSIPSVLLFENGEERERAVGIPEALELLTRMSEK